MKKTYLSIFFLILLIVIVAFFFKETNREIHIKLGLYSGNDWKVPKEEAYKIFDEAIQEFESLNPDVRVTYRSGTMREDYSEWLAQKILTGDEPDVFIVAEEDFNTLASIGILQDLTSFIKEESGFKKEDYYEKAFDSGKFKGLQVGLPFQLVPTFMIANKTLLQKEGISIPDSDFTWNEFYNICKKVTKDTDGDEIIDQFGVQGFEWEQALYADGQSIFDYQGRSLAYTDKAMRETIEFLFNLKQLNKGKIVEPQNFESGKVAFKPFSLVEYRTYKSYPYKIIRYSDFEWTAIRFPNGPSGKSREKLYTVQMSMSSRSKEKEAAWRFIYFLTNNKNIQYKVWRYTNALPSNKKVVNDIYNYKDKNQEMLAPSFLQDIIEESVTVPRFKKYEDIKKQMDSKIYPIVMGSKTIDDGLRELKRSMIDYYLEK